MSFSGFKRFFPTFIPLTFELVRYFKRDLNHNNKIRNSDKTAQKIATMEHLLIRLEKKIQVNRETYEKISSRVYVWLFINSVLLIGILAKLFFM